MNERDRLVKVMECEGMNAKQFSIEVGISAGTISNILGGRNKPSLEVMQAILNRFRTISCQWLIMGTGSMFLTPNGETSRTLFPAMDEDVQDKQHTDNKPDTQPCSADTSAARSVRKILIFYSDGTFEER